jgi:CheY-like chemotaxis protein
VQAGSIRSEVRVARDGLEALAFLRRQGEYATAPRPDLILLDLNLPRKDGREVLVEIKADPALKRLPVVILTSAPGEAEVRQAYDLGASCYVVKPAELEAYFTAVQAIEEFWLTRVRLPSG